MLWTSFHWMTTKSKQYVPHKYKATLRKRGNFKCTAYLSERTFYSRPTLDKIMKRVIGSLVWHDSLCPEFMRPKRYEDDPKISLSPKIWSTPFMVSWLPRIHVYPYYTSLGWEIIGVRYQRKIVHTVSQIARNPWSNTERGHLLEANWSNNFEFIQRLAKSLWILKDTEIKSPPYKVIALQ